MRRKKKVKILWDRVVIAVFIFIFLIMAVVLGLKKVVTFISDRNNSSNNKASSSQSSPENTINAKYNFIEVTQDKIHNGTLILVNSTYPYSGKNEDIVDVVSQKSTDYKVILNTSKLSKEVIEGINNLTKDFVSASSVSDLMLATTYRTVDEQQKICDGVKGKADKEKLPQNQQGNACELVTGYSFEFGIFPNGKSYPVFDGTDKYKWIPENAYKYGFVQRYEDGKQDKTGYAVNPAFYRYVGLPHSAVMHEKKLCFEEYIDELKKYKFENNEMTVEMGESEYKIYYVAATGDKTKVPVPKDKEYTISGNNVDGFIVTYKTK